jgi:hypothetical protein
MDPLVKHVAGRLKAQPAPGPHPDAELLSAFAENALPEADRGRLLQHLGACSDCREILFLALPESAEAQKVLILKPSRFRRWELTWGATVAAVAVAAVLFTTQRLEQKNLRAKMVAPASAPRSEAAADIQAETGTENNIAAEAPPPELDQMQAAREASATDKKIAAAEENAAKPQPEAKHMTGKMQAPLVFDRSGEVHVQSPAQSARAAGAVASNDNDRDKAKQDHAVAGFSGGLAQPASAGTAADSERAVNEISKSTANLRAATGQQTAAVQTPADQTPANQTADQASAISQPKVSTLQAEASNAPSPAPPPPGSTATSSLEGVIVDASGAVVSNAKVTTVGPAGAKIATSDSEGRFSFDQLPPGFYSVKAEANGFKAAEITQVAVLDNKLSDLRVTLDVGASSDVVEVTGAAVEIDSPNGLVAGRQPAELTARKALPTSAAASPPSIGAKATNLQWTLSPKGVVQRSSDSGKTWQPVSVANAAAFRALSAVGANIWVGGKAGALYHSSDSGQTWGRVEPAAGSKKLDHDIVRVDFSDALKGAVNTISGEVWATSDGGQTWALVNAAQVAH